jgi:WD40 repeat protein
VWDIKGRPKLVSSGSCNGSETNGNIAASPDGAWLAIAQVNVAVNYATLWNTTTGKSRTAFEGQLAQGGLAFSPDGRLLATNGVDGVLVVQKAATGEVVFRHRVPGLLGGPVAFSPDGRQLVVNAFKPNFFRGTYGSGVLRCWNTARWKEGEAMKSGRAQRLAFSPDGKRLASHDLGGTVTVWDLSSGQVALPLAEVRGSKGVHLAFSADGHRLLAFSDQGEITTWDASPAP